MNWYKIAKFNTYSYIGRCVELPGEFVTFLVDHSEEIEWKEAVKLVPYMEEYNPSGHLIPLKDDYAVSFAKGFTPLGLPFVYFDHNRIEHIFVLGAHEFDMDGELEKISELEDEEWENS